MLVICVKHAFQADHAVICTEWRPGAASSEIDRTVLRARIGSDCAASKTL
jgi:hypothetical protein